MIKWITIPDFPNYEVSNRGEIRNKITSKILKPWDDGKGYLQVNLNGKTVRVHRIVAKTFFDIECQNLEVNHGDGNKKNNFIGNLEWMSGLENKRHAHKTGLIPHNGQGGLARKKIKISETGQVFKSLRSCAREINGDHVHISECLRGIRKSHKGFHFEEV